MNSKPLETMPENGDVRQNTSDGQDRPASSSSRRRIAGVYGFALLVALVLFYFHVVVIFDVIGELLRYKGWLQDDWGRKDGKLFCSVASPHSFWPTSLRPQHGAFFSAGRSCYPVLPKVSTSPLNRTTLGYGDILLKYPWRHLGTLIAITGVLMFGCSTAFLFVVLHEVWLHY